MPRTWPEFLAWWHAHHAHPAPDSTPAYLAWKREREADDEDRAA